MADVQVVRSPLRARPRSRRTLDQRLALRFPGLAAANFRMLARLPPASRLRRAALARAVQLTLEAFNRRDLEAVVVGAHPDFEYRPEPNWVAAGLVDESYRGLEGYRRFVMTVDEVWGGENRLKPVEVIDMGEQFVILAHGEMRAQASGVELVQEYAGVTTLKDGRPIRVQEYYDHAEGLAAVGLET
jgi:ketosteroid isomerase-like protein